MRDDIVIRNVLMDCPACGHRHFVEERDREVCWTIANQNILSHERYYHCPFADEEYNEWQTYEMEEESSQNGHDTSYLFLRSGYTCIWQTKRNCHSWRGFKNGRYSEMP